MRIIKPIVLSATMLFLLSFMACVKENVGFTQHFSPLNAVPGGPSGPATNKLKVQPYCCPSTAIEITALNNGAITDTDLQWVEIPLNGIQSGQIKDVTVCYQVMGTGDSYISQVRLTEMTLPNTATVMLDDGKNNNSKTPICYTTPAVFEVKGTITLALRIVLAPNDKILVSGISISR